MNNSHYFQQTDLQLQMQVLNISVNMARIGNWIISLEDLKLNKGFAVYQSRLDLIKKMINQTENYLKDINHDNVSEKFQLTLKRFKEDFNHLKLQPIMPEKYLYWTEKALTWADILQHRAKLA